MDVIGLFILISVCVVLFLSGWLRRSGYLHFPFLAALVTLGWFLPQAIRLLDSTRLPANSFMLTMLYTSACLLAALLAWRKRERFVSIPDIPQYNSNKLMIYSAVLSAVGLLAYSTIFRIQWNFTDDGLTTGLVTILFFFAKLKYFGLAIAMALLFRKFSWVAFAIVAINLNAISGFLILGGRRGPLVFVLLMIAVLLYFRRGVVIPKAALIISFVLATLFVNGAGTYRQLVEAQGRMPTINELLESGITEATYAENKAFEVTNAINYVAASYESFQYNYGIQYWNFFVFSYIPGQLIGASNKKALMIDVPDVALQTYGHRRHIGTTMTGFADSFMAFSFFGVLIFYIISRFMKRIWHAACRDDISAQIMYACTITVALHAITHSTQWFFIFFLQAILFLLPGFYWARKRHGKPNRELSRSLSAR